MEVHLDPGDERQHGGNKRVIKSQVVDAYIGSCRFHHQSTKGTRVPGVHHGNAGPLHVSTSQVIKDIFQFEGVEKQCFPEVVRGRDTSVKLVIRKPLLCENVSDFALLICVQVNI